MGQQQLLLIVLGVIIVGIAVVVGINVFTASSVQANRDAVISDCTTLGSMAQQYYRKPVALGGGGNAFNTSGGAASNWALPATLDTTGNGTYSINITAANSLTITGVGTETGDNGTAPVNVSVVVSPTNMTTTINN